MNLEKKLKELEESCLRSASKETETLKQEINSDIEAQMKLELKEYTDRKQWNFNKTVEKLEKDYMKEIFNFQTECKKDILQAKEEMYKDLKQNVKQRLEEYTENEEYKSFLFDSIDNVLLKSKGSSNITIGITSKDYERFKDEIKASKNVDVIEINNCYIGGCILKSNEIFIDNTLLNNLEEKMIEENE